MKVARVYVTTLVCFLSFVFFASLPAKAEEIFVETITKTDIYKKQGNSWIKIGALREKEPLKVLSSLDEKYYTVQIGEQTAYILKENTKPAENFDSSLFIDKGSNIYLQMYTIKSTPIYYFQGTQRKELAIIEKNVKFSMISENDSFYQIIVAGRKAYIDKNNVHFLFPQNNKSFQVAVKSVPVYYNKLGKGVEVGLLKQGQTFYSKSEYNGQWHVIEFGRLTGYVPKTGIKPVTQKMTPVLSEPFTYLVKVGRKTDVYNSTATERVAIATVYPGQVFAAKKLVGNYYQIVVAGKIAYLPKGAVNDRIDSKDVVNPNQTYGQIIYWHFHQSKTQAQRDYRLALMLSKKTKYSLVKPTKNPSGGGYKDWFVIRFKRPGFTIEVAPYVGERPVPLKYFPSIWNKNNSVPIMLANSV